MDRSTADVLSADGRKMLYQTLASGLGVGSWARRPLRPWMAAMERYRDVLERAARAITRSQQYRYSLR
jgi:hypothetical protein